MVLYQIILSLYFLFHPFHVSVCEINYHRQKDALQVSHRIFTDDLENTLSRRFETVLYIHESPPVVIDNALSTYLKENVDIYVDGKKLSLEYLGFEIEQDVVWCYQEVEQINFNGNITISNTLLFETFDDQQNILHFSVDGTVKSLKFNKRNISGKLNF